MNSEEMLAMNLKRLRKKAHLTQTALALKAGLGKNVPGTIESMAHKANTGTISKLAKALGVTNGHFFREPRV